MIEPHASSTPSPRAPQPLALEQGAVVKLAARAQCIAAVSDVALPAVMKVHTALRHACVVQEDSEFGS